MLAPCGGSDTWKRKDEDLIFDNKLVDLELLPLHVHVDGCFVRLFFFLHYVAIENHNKIDVLSS